MPTDTATALSTEIVNQIGDDFRTRAPPFDEYQAPEREALDQIDFYTHTAETQLRFLTFSAALDYQRDADLHWEEMASLFDSHRYLFKPNQVAKRGTDHVQSIFSDHRIRYPNRDGGTWVTIAETILEEYSGSLSMLLSVHDNNALSIYNRIRSSGFPFLGGDKISPFWTRLVHEYVAPLDNLHGIPIPVDVQVRSVTEYFTAVDDDEDIRWFWTEFCRDSEYDPLELDEPLWLIGRDFDDWGKEYLAGVSNG